MLGLIYHLKQRITPDTSSHLDLLRRSALVIQFTFAFSICGMLFIPLAIYWQDMMGAFWVGVAVVFVIFTPLILHRTHNPTLAGNWLMAQVYGILIWRLFEAGGRMGSTYAWVLSIPLLATMLGKRKSGLIWTALVLPIPIIFYAFHRFGWLRPAPPQEYAQMLGAISLVLLGCALSYLAFIYETYNEESLNFIQSLTIKDELTKLHNRRGLLAFAEERRKFCKRAGKKMAIIYLDLNKFKSINDKYGHHEGDLALAETANMLRASIRESDIVGRIGGDEFVVVAALNEDKDIGIILDRLFNILDIHNEATEKPYKISFSHGVVLMDPSESLTIEEAINQADRLMYKQKRYKKKK